MRIFKWFWHLLFDTRTFEWRSRRAVTLYGCWNPRIGGDIGFHIDFCPLF